MSNAPPPFGRRTPRATAAAIPAGSDDLRLFLMTFAGGLVFFGTLLA